MLRNAAQTLPPPAQMLNCLLMHQSWAWEVCCLRFAHPCSAEKSLHIHSLCIQRLNACPDSPWSRMLPPTHVQRVWAPENTVSGTHRCLFLYFCRNCVHSSVSHHNLMEHLTHLHTGLCTFHSCTLHVSACLCAQTGNQYVLQTVRRAHLWVHVYVCFCRHTDMSAQTLVHSVVRGWLAEVVLWFSFPA